MPIFLPRNQRQPANGGRILPVDLWGGLVMFCASIRTLWKRLVFRGVDFSDKHGAFETAYLVSDPYNLESPQEQHRFVQTNRIIEETFGHVDNILEIGCGEGRQSFYLQELCGRLEGIDISNRAVERARKHCPQGIFRQGDIVDCSGHFDLVTAFEVVYYSSDIANVLERMSALGNANRLKTFTQTNATTTCPPRCHGAQSLNSCTPKT